MEAKANGKSCVSSSSSEFKQPFFLVRSDFLCLRHDQASQEEASLLSYNPLVHSKPYLTHHFSIY